MRALLLLALLAGARACATFGNYQALSTASLALYNLTNPCMLTCNAGFYGDFCQAAPPASDSLSVAVFSLHFVQR